MSLSKKLDKLKKSFAANGLSGVRSLVTDTIKYNRRKFLDYPESIMIEASSRCNLRCAFCWIVKADLKRKRTFIPFEEVKKLVDEIEGRCNTIAFSFCGEPTLNKDLFKMVRYAADKKITTGISSNATRLTPEKNDELLDSGLAFLKISFDGACKETYEEIRIGAEYKIILANIENLVQKKAKRGSKFPNIEMQMVVTKKNYQEINDYIKMCRELGVDQAYFKTLYIDKRGKDSYVQPLLKDFFIDGEMSRYEGGKEGKLVLKQKSRCDIRNTPVINSDGQVVMCCFDIYSKQTFGNIRDKNFMSIWREYKKFRHNQMYLRKLPLCRDCDTDSHIHKTINLSNNSIESYLIK